MDVNIHGCPASRREIGYVVRCLASGLMPAAPNYPVCVECKMRETICRFEYNEICLGVVTRGGCNAPCPAAGLWCFGCRGLVDDANVEAAEAMMARYGRAADELRSRMELFNSAEAAQCPGR